MRMKNIKWREEYTDISDSGCDANLHPGVALFGQLTLEEFVQFGVENPIGDKLPPFGNGTPLCSGSHDCGGTMTWNGGKRSRVSMWMTLPIKTRNLGEIWIRGTRVPSLAKRC